MATRATRILSIPSIETFGLIEGPGATCRNLRNRPRAIPRRITFATGAR
jgi:hypothetical protein